MGIPVVPFVAANRKNYGAFYAAIERATEEKPCLAVDNLRRLYETANDTTTKNIGEFIPENGIVQYSPL